MTTINLTLLIYQIQKRVYCALTGRTFQVSSLFIIDVLGAISAVCLKVKFNRVKGNMDPDALDDSSLEDVDFMRAMLTDITYEVFNIPVLISLVSALAWIRVLACMIYTSSLGPRVVTILRMINDIGQFMVVYLVQLIAFTFFASMAFFEVSELNGFYNSGIVLFDTSFGDYDMGIFDVY